MIGRKTKIQTKRRARVGASTKENGRKRKTKKQKRVKNIRESPFDKLLRAVVEEALKKNSMYVQPTEYSYKDPFENEDSPDLVRKIPLCGPPNRRLWKQINGESDDETD